MKLFPERISHFSVRAVENSDARVTAADADLNQFPRSRHRQALQTDGIEELEDRRVGPDAEREREHDDGSETGVLEQLAEGVLKIVHE